MLQLVNHGGKCCGIKIIYGFKGGPEEPEPAVAGTASPCNEDAYGAEVSSSLSFYNEEAPKETTLRRLDRYLKYVKRRRPSHLIEIVLSSMRVWRNVAGEDPCLIQQNDLWGPLVVERGFSLVSTFTNSNSNNTCYVYHKILEKEGKKAP